MRDATIVRLWSMTLIALIMVVDAFTWKIDHALWSLGISVISGLAGYEIRGYKENTKEKMEEG